MAVSQRRFLGVHPSRHYEWLKNPNYAKDFRNAEDTFADHVREEVRRRAIDGWEEPIVYKGQLQPGTVRKYSDRLLELLAKAKCLEFRDRHEVAVKAKTLEEILAGSYED